MSRQIFPAEACTAEETVGSIGATPGECAGVRLVNIGGVIVGTVVNLGGIVIG